MRKILLGFIRFYQLYISKLFPRSCRYYPSCSEYAIWQFKFNSIHGAFKATLKRILCCNQLFRGGIDYPIAFIYFSHFAYKKQPIYFWFVPIKDNRYYIIKSIC